MLKSMTLYKSSGILKYSIASYGYKLVMEIDKQISEYYRSLMPKYIKTNRQMYAPHVSVVRKEIPVNLQYWGKYEGEEVDFYYDNTVHYGKVYCWLNVFCKRLEEIRTELGLSVDSPYTLPPEETGCVKCFHTTIGNFKGL